MIMNLIYDTCIIISVVGLRDIAPMTSQEVSFLLYSLCAPLFLPAATLCCYFSAYLKYDSIQLSNLIILNSCRHGNWPPSFKSKEPPKNVRHINVNALTFWYRFVRIESYSYISLWLIFLLSQWCLLVNQS